MKTIPIKEFRNNLSSVADMVESGETITVIRRSKPAFVVTPCKEEEWKTIVNFTNDATTDGVDIKDVIAELKKK